MPIKIRHIITVHRIPLLIGFEIQGPLCNLIVNKLDTLMINDDKHTVIVQLSFCQSAVCSQKEVQACSFGLSVNAKEKKNDGLLHTNADLVCVY